MRQLIKNQIKFGQNNLQKTFQASLISSQFEIKKLNFMNKNIFGAGKTLIDFAEDAPLSVAPMNTVYYS